MLTNRILLHANRSYFACESKIIIRSNCFNRDRRVNAIEWRQNYHANSRRSSGNTINILNFERCHTSSPSSCLGPDSGELNWRAVVSEAEQMVGYPTSFLNLRWLFNDEIAVAATQLRKLVGCEQCRNTASVTNVPLTDNPRAANTPNQVGTNHPLLKSAKNILVGSKSNLQSVGLVVLLVSKAAGFGPDQFLEQHSSGVLSAQRALAEIVEMKRTGHIIHRAMANLRDRRACGGQYEDLLCGNKIVLLSGDYLLAKCLKHLGDLRNNEVTELISTGLRDLVEGDFFGEMDADGNPLPSKPKASNAIERIYDWENENNLGKLGSSYFLGQGKDEWKLRTMLTSGSLLAKGCQAAMKLSKQGVEMEREAYRLGGHLAMIWQLYLDVKDFFTHPHSYSLVGAPVIIAIWEYPTVYGHIFEAKLEKRGVDFKQLFYAVRGTRALEYLRLFLDEELLAVVRCTERFPVEDARLALNKMAASIHIEAVQFLES